MFPKEIPNFPEDLIPDFYEGVVQNLNEMRQKSFLTDIVLVCGLKKFQAHRVYLSATSTYLCDVFKTNEKVKEGVLEFPTIDAEGLEIALNILYTGKLLSLDFDQLKNVLPALHLLELDEIYSRYLKTFLPQLSSDNFITYWELGDKLEDNNVLEAVYDILAKSYHHKEFENVELLTLKKMFQRFSENKESHNLFLKVFTNWIKVKEEDRIQYTDELMKLIDFEKVCGPVLAEALLNPFVAQCEVLKDTMTPEKYAFYNIYLKDSKRPPTVFLYGKSKDGKCILQKFSYGEWEKDISLEESDSDYSSMIVSKSEFYVVAKCSTGNMLKNEAQLIKFDEKGKTQITMSLVSVPSENTIVATKFKNVFAISAYGEHFLVDFFCSEDCLLQFMDESDSKMKTVKRQLVACEEGLFKISQEVSEEDKMSLNIQQFSKECNEEFLTVKRIDWKPERANWFAYFLPPKQLVFRSFPGDTVYYSVEENDIEVKQENNDITDVVSLYAFGNTISCLSRTGCVYVQHLDDNKDWNLVIKSPVPLQEYKQIILDVS